MKQIKEFPGYYITRSGEVWSERPRNFSDSTGLLHRLKPRKKKREKGRLYVGLCKDGKPFNKTVHRLLAETFLPKPPGSDARSSPGRRRGEQRSEQSGLGFGPGQHNGHAPWTCTVTGSPSDARSCSH